MLAGLLSGAGSLTRVEGWDKAPEKPQDLGHVLILIDTTRLGVAETLAGRVDAFRDILHETPPADPADPATPVRLPGEASMALHRRRLEQAVRLMLDQLDG